MSTEDEVDQLHGQIDELKAEIVTLHFALQRYGLHTWDCAHNDSKGEEPCNCGWTELLQKCHGQNET